MRNVFSRRDFLKASAAAVLAASAAGVLTGCDGGGSEIPSATIGLGEFEVTMTGNMKMIMDKDDIQTGLTMLYECFGWDPELGCPTAECLDYYDMPDVKEDLAARGLLPDA